MSCDKCERLKMATPVRLTKYLFTKLASRGQMKVVTRQIGQIKSRMPFTTANVSSIDACRCETQIRHKQFSSTGTALLLLHVNILQQSVSSARSISTDTDSSDRICWKCQKHIETEDIFFCKCGVIMKPILGLDYFRLFNLEKNFDLDEKQLSLMYKDIQRHLHPDKFTQKSLVEKQYSADQSSLVNKAYRTLIKPLSRGLYMLELEGVPIDEKTENTDIEPEFLMSVMETNEAIQEADSLEDVRQIGEKNTVVLDQLLTDLSEAFNNKELQAARHTLIHLKYYANIDEKVRQIERNEFGSD